MIQRIANIEFIYFDVGGVVVLDFSKTGLGQRTVPNLPGAPTEPRTSFSALEVSSSTSRSEKKVSESPSDDPGEIKVVRRTSKWAELQDDLGVNPEDREEFFKIFDPATDELCRGKVAVDDLLPELKKRFDISYDQNYSLLDDFVQRFDPNPQLGELITELSGAYKLGLLTNMYKGMFDKIVAEDLLPDVRWDIIVDSTKVGMIKPEPKIFKYATKQAGVAPENILFIDNTQRHLDAAAKLGWHTHLYDPAVVEQSNDTLRDILLT